MFLKDSLTNANDLRIAKLYSAMKVDKMYGGHILGIETVKVVPFFVLIKKTSKGYIVIPTEKFKTNQLVFENASSEHDIIVNKTNVNNRYRKPTTLCPDLENKMLSNEELVRFAQMVETINAELPSDYAEEKLKLVCLQQNELLNERIARQEIAQSL